MLRIKILQAYKYTLRTSVSTQSAIALTSPRWRTGSWFSFFHCLPSLSFSHTLGSLFLFSFFHQLTLCPWLLPSFPSSLTHSFLYVLAWQNVLIGNKLWEGSQSEVETASDLPLMVSLLSSVGSVTSLFAVAECTCLQRRSVETTRRHPDGYQQSEHDRKRCKMRIVRCSQVAEHNSKRDLTFTVCLKEC